MPPPPLWIPLAWPCMAIFFSQVYCPLPATNRAPDWKGQVCSYPSPSARSAVHRYLPRRARPPSSIVVPCHPRDARASRSARFALRASRCQTRGEKTATRLSLPTRRTTGWQVRAHANGWRAASPRIGAPCAAANLLSLPARQCSRRAATSSTVIA